LTNITEPAAGQAAGKLARPLHERLANLAGDVMAAAGPSGHEVTKDEIDALWVTRT